MNLYQRLSPAAIIVMSSLLLLTALPSDASGQQVISKVPKAHPDKQDNDYNNNGGDPNDYSNVFGNNPQDSIDSSLGLVLDSHAMTSFIDKTLFKNMAALLLVNLVTLAVIIFVVWIFVICALKPGCPVYNWREIGARSHHPRLLQDGDEALLQPL